MPPYLIVDTEIENADEYEKYKASAKPITEQYGGVYRARGANMGVLETGLVDRGLIKPPFFIQTIFGILGGIGADEENLMHMRRMALKLFGEDHEWSVLAAGRFQMPYTTRAGTMGGNVRVGLEDSLYLGKGQFAETNAQQVTKIRRILEDLSLSIATPDEARQRLALKGAENIGF